MDTEEIAQIIEQINATLYLARTNGASEEQEETRDNLVLHLENALRACDDLESRA